MRTTRRLSGPGKVNGEHGDADDQHTRNADKRLALPAKKINQHHDSPPEDQWPVLDARVIGCHQLRTRPTSTWINPDAG